MKPRNIPFSPPHVTEEMIAEVVATLRSGWITTGPRTKEFERQITAYCGNRSTIAVNSATAGLELMLRWFGIGPGDEVIVPAYTYCATANVAVHLGATVVMVDVSEDDLCIDPERVKAAITSRTKAIIPVDLGGLPVSYDRLKDAVLSRKDVFRPNGTQQEQLGRPLILSDAAHSFGATYRGERTGTQADATVFSFHAVKNLTTAEGGAIAFHLPAPFDHDALYREMNIRILHGQTKDALAKSGAGAWKYDVTEAGFKANMTDLQAALGLIQLKEYPEHLTHRRTIFNLYDLILSADPSIRKPLAMDAERESCRHLYIARAEGLTEAQRDAAIQLLAADGIAANVHYQPLPLLSFYRRLGYRVEDYPIAWRSYQCEVTLPVYRSLTLDDATFVAERFLRAIEQVRK